MIEELKLKGSELLCFALIYGFCQDNKSKFEGSIAYISKWLGVDKSNTIKILKRLEEKNFIFKDSCINDGVTINTYKINHRAFNMLQGGSSETLLPTQNTQNDANRWWQNTTRGSSETLPNNNIYKGFKGYKDYNVINRKEFLNTFIEQYPKNYNYDVYNNIFKWVLTNIKESDVILMNNILNELEETKKSYQWIKNNGKYIPRADIWIQRLTPNLKYMNSLITVNDIKAKWLPQE